MGPWGPEDVRRVGPPLASGLRVHVHVSYRPAGVHSTGRPHCSAVQAGTARAPCPSTSSWPCGESEWTRWAAAGALRPPQPGSLMASWRVDGSCAGGQWITRVSALALQSPTDLSRRCCQVCAAADKSWVQLPGAGGLCAFSAGEPRAKLGHTPHGPPGRFPVPRAPCATWLGQETHSPGFLLFTLHWPSWEMWMSLCPRAAPC